MTAAQTQRQITSASVFSSAICVRVARADVGKARQRPMMVQMVFPMIAAHLDAGSGRSEIAIEGRRVDRIGQQLNPDRLGGKHVICVSNN